eukprot:CAMPEP_0115847404 /NCGR_PEP_ID=MMETSP0287-20121206/10366_1 /TAXON_ID=412157 /ORGANISM="Chrysochromulina rotalis, Strain UIO044" /LENGTH=233 /DNA_ID=CAMNT_0003301239 /DNA_START=27 /DNA_END=728 /DNA_ORIENTATION=+
MAGPSFGAIKLLQTRTGAPRSACKAALEQSAGDEDAAAAHIAATTEFSDSKAMPVEKPTTLEEDIASAATDVSVIRIEVGDQETYPQYGDTCHMHYRGMLQSDGTQFDSSYERGREFSFKIGHGKVIKGWDIAIGRMSVGEKALLMVPSSLAYGPAGNGPIPPNADLKFEVHLVKVTPQTSCLGPGQHGGVQRQSHEYAKVADQLLGRAPREDLEFNLPDDRQPMPLTSDMPR